jgi:hypothetical protein
MKTNNGRSAKSIKNQREAYTIYSKDKHTFIGIGCVCNHFFVVKLIYNINDDDIFKQVVVYDSVTQPPTEGENIVSAISIHWKLLVNDKRPTTTIEEVWKYVEILYYHETLQQLYKYNITPAIVHGLQPDKNKPPPKSDKKEIGRPKNQKVRDRPTPCPTKEIRCSICGETKHSKLTCVRRKKAKKYDKNCFSKYIFAIW